MERMIALCALSALLAGVVEAQPPSPLVQNVTQACREYCAACVRARELLLVSDVSCASALIRRESAPSVAGDRIRFASGG